MPTIETSAYTFRVRHQMRARIGPNYAYSGNSPETVVDVHQEGVGWVGVGLQLDEARDCYGYQKEEAAL